MCCVKSRLALNVDEVDAIKAAARKHGRVVAEAFMYRHHPQTLKVQELVKSGSLGTLKLIRGSFSFMLSREGDVRLDPAMGGGSIWDVGCYPISYARSVLGENRLRCLAGRSQVRQGSMRHSSGRCASVTTSMPSLTVVLSSHSIRSWKLSGAKQH